MAKTNDTKPSLFHRLEELRTIVKNAREAVNQILLTMDRNDKPDPTGWPPAHDLYLQLSNAYTSLDDAFDELAPGPGHIDQPLPASPHEVANG
jgi:hypothetical protein